jgi:rhamnosyltransferase
MPNFIIVLLTLNAASDWRRFAGALLASTSPKQVLLIDSSSTDNTVELARTSGFNVRTIARESFNHGGTRQFAADLLPEADILVYLTQDALLTSSATIVELLQAFENPEIGATYGRQLPRIEATPIEQHARLFNYPHESSVRALESREHLGFKSIFISNSFAAYRREALMAVGGFPHDVIFGEDTITAAKLLLAGWKIAYVAEAQVYHSHSYTWRQEFRRYFDIGVLHSREQWLLNEFGQVSGEGKRFVLSELRYLWPKHISMIPSALIRTALKFTGYRLGRSEQKLSPAWKRRLSMNRSYWK